jgi:hypothetical protein
MAGCAAAGLARCSRSTYVIRFKMWRQVVCWSDDAKANIKKIMCDGKYKNHKHNVPNWVAQVAKLHNTDGNMYPICENAENDDNDDNEKDDDNDDNEKKKKKKKDEDEDDDDDQHDDDEEPVKTQDETVKDGDGDEDDDDDQVQCDVCKKEDAAFVCDVKSCDWKMICAACVNKHADAKSKKHSVQRYHRGRSE